MKSQFYIKNNTGKVLEIHSREALKEIAKNSASYKNSTDYSYYQSDTKRYITKYEVGEYVPIVWILSGGYAVQRSKLWASDTGRTALTGKYTGTLIGIFPKITITIKGNKLFKEDVQSLVRLVDQQTVSCKYYEERIEGLREAEFYFDDANVAYVRNKTVGSSYKNQYNDINITAVATTKYTGD